MSDLPPGVEAKVRRILRREARRLLAEKLDRDAIGAAPGCDGDALDGRADEVAPAGEAEVVPVRRRVDDDGGTAAT